MKKLYFIRHGLSEMNVLGLRSGHTDTPLTEAGREQAKKAGQSAKNLDIDLIVASPLARAYETAKIIAREINYAENRIALSDMLKERHFGNFEGKPYSVDDNLAGDPSVETEAAIVERARQAIDWINGLETKHVLIVSHGSIGRAIRSVLKQDYPMSHPEQLNNAEIVYWVEN